MRIAHRLATVALLLATALLLAAGCGPGDEGGATDSASDKETTTTSVEGGGEVVDAAQADAKLDVRLEQVGGRDLGIPVPPAVTCDRKLPATCRATITCPAEDGDAERAAVCVWLRGEGAELLTEEPAGREVCTMQYGGPTTATVTGTLDGERIDAEFSRENGCAINRFDMAAPLWTGIVPPDPSSPNPGSGDAASGACLANPDAPVSSVPSPSRDPDAADAAADQDCSVGPPPGAGTTEPDVISDPPEAFDK